MGVAVAGVGSLVYRSHEVTREPSSVFDARGKPLPSAFFGIPASERYMAAIRQPTRQGDCPPGRDFLKALRRFLSIRTVSAMDCPTGGCAGSYYVAGGIACGTECGGGYREYFFSDPNSAGPNDGWGYPGMTACAGCACREAACDSGGN